MVVLHSALMATYIALICYGAWSDARALRIPNEVSLALLATFIPTAVLAGIGLEAIAWHLGAGVLVLAVGFSLFAVRLFGGGDAKLLAAIALWIGWGETLVVFVVAVALVGGVLSLAVVLLRKGLGLWPDWLVKSAQGLFTPNKAIPYGIAISAGALFVVPRMDVLPQGWLTLAQLIVG